MPAFSRSSHSRWSAISPSAALSTRCPPQTRLGAHFENGIWILECYILNIENLNFKISPELLLSASCAGLWPHLPVFLICFSQSNSRGVVKSSRFTVRLTKRGGGGWGSAHSTTTVRKFENFDPLQHFNVIT